jgi:hypothetical protein
MSLRPVTEISLLFMLIMSVPHRKHTYRPPRSATGYMYILFTVLGYLGTVLRNPLPGDITGLPCS